MNNQSIVTAHFVVCHGGNLAERAELPLDPKTLRVQMDILAVHDCFDSAVLKFNLILDLLLHCLFLILITRTFRDVDLFVSYGVILTHNVIHLPV